jgi:glycosyltransferase involved in cell wall biosynthesis
MPLLTVVVATRDRSQRLRRALGSLRDQTMEDLEVVVVDDGSTDDTSDYMADLVRVDRRITYLRLEGGSGAAGARNRGIEASSGEFLGFLDDDDEWLSNKAAEQIEFLRSHPQIGLVSCNFLVDDERRGTLLPHRGPLDFKPDVLLWANVLMGCSFVMLRRAAYSFDVRFDERFVNANDWDLWIRCSAECGVATLPSVLGRYARHGPQLTDSSERIHRGDAAILDKHGERMSESARAYHRAHLRMLLATGVLARAKVRTEILRDTPRAVLGVMARVAVSGRVGRAIGDPGRPFRTLARAAGRVG